MENVPQETDLSTASIRSTGSDVRINDYGSDVQLRYLVDGQSVRIIRSRGTETFGSDEISRPDEENYVLFQKSDSNGNPVATLSLERPHVGAVLLTYARIGIFTFQDTQPEAATFVFGTTTADAEMPRSGSASFATALSGVVVASDGSTTQYYSVHDDGATFSANFAEMSVTTTLHLLASPASGPDRDFGTLLGNGEIAASGPGFSGNFGSSGIAGGFTGAFFGPGAAEAGLVFRATGPDYTATGTVVGTLAPP